MTPEEILRALLAAAAQQPAAPAVGAAPPQQAALQTLIAALVAKPQQPDTATPVPVLSPIDSALGGQMLAGKKTVLAVVAYALMSILQATNVVGYATGPEYKDPKTTAAPAAATTTTPAAPATTAPAAKPATPPAPAGSAPRPAAPAASTAAPAAPATAENGKTPTGVILTTLIAAFGALGFFAKIDRALGVLGVAAGTPPPAK
jgi:hypothetical protein